MTQCTIDFEQLAVDIKQWGQELGFQQVGISDVNLEKAEERLKNWLQNKYHGEMTYMAAHGDKRSKPALLLPGTLRIITVRMDYLPMDSKMIETLRDKQKGYISRYALGRDYHKVIRKRLKRLAERINDRISHFHYRVFVDSAPVLEKAIAEKGGLGWIGKNTLVINKKAGSWFFLGEIYTNLPLPIDIPATNHCGSCTACLTICPTNAFLGPYQLDARRCISYLTIELKTSIPVELRPPIGNRIFGCDDCQIVCPWNKFARFTQEKDFHPRANLSTPSLLELFAWSEEEFNRYTEGSAIRRTGYEGWLRNIAVALGNATSSEEVINALEQKRQHSSDLVREHVLWALSQLQL